MKKNIYDIVKKNKLDFEISKRMNFARNNLQHIMCFFIVNNIYERNSLLISSNFHQIKFTG